MTRREAKALYRDEHLSVVRATCMFECRACGQTLPPAARCRSQGAGDICRACRREQVARWQAENRDRNGRSKRDHHLRKKFGMDQAEFERLFAAQGNVCAICCKPPVDARGSHPHVDHDHETGRVRGILCGPCNRAIGQLADDPERCERAAIYLRSAA